MKIREITESRAANDLRGLSVVRRRKLASGEAWEGNLDVSFSDLTSLEGAPSKVNGSFNCNGNRLTSLDGSPVVVGENFYCVKNLLTSLKGGPVEVGADFNCAQNSLTSLEGAPSSIPNDFVCNDNPLTTLEGAPSSIDRKFRCTRTRLTSLHMIHKHIKHIGGSISLIDTPIKECMLGLLLIDGLKGIDLIVVNEDDEFSVGG